MSAEITVTVKDAERVTLVFIERDSYGRVRDRFQRTVSRRMIERALESASFVVPWREAKS